MGKTCSDVQGNPLSSGKSEGQSMAGSYVGLSASILVYWMQDDTNYDWEPP